MTLILDTDVLIELYKGSRAVRDTIAGLLPLHPKNPAITFANFSEFYYGILGREEKEREKALLFLDKFTLLNTTRASAKKFSELKYLLERAGKTIPILDILIASLAMETKLTLLTMDKHFGKIEGLDVILL